eukprot:784786-Prorocentrum_minimum.AAC.3
MQEPEGATPSELSGLCLYRTWKCPDVCNTDHTFHDQSFNQKAGQICTDIETNDSSLAVGVQSCRRYSNI